MVLFPQGAPFGAGGNSDSNFGDGESWDSGSEVSVKLMRHTCVISLRWGGDDERRVLCRASRRTVQIFLTHVLNQGENLSEDVYYPYN